MESILRQQRKVGGEFIRSNDEILLLMHLAISNRLLRSFPVARFLRGFRASSSPWFRLSIKLNDKTKHIFSTVNRKRIYCIRSTAICMAKLWNCAFAVICGRKPISIRWNHWSRPFRRTSKMRAIIWILNHFAVIAIVRFLKTMASNEFSPDESDTLS